MIKFIRTLFFSVPTVIGILLPAFAQTAICACVVPPPGTRPPDLETLRQHLGGQGLAQYKAPERLVVLDSLPIVGDKIDRQALALLAVPLP